MTSRRTAWLILAVFLGAPWVAAARTALERPFVLVDTSGRTVSDKNFRGFWVLVFFGYTGCSDSCPMTLSAIGTILDQLGSAAAQVRPVFITVDPTRDTTEVLRKYLAAFDRRIIGLTGSDDQIARAAANFGAQYFQVPGMEAREDMVAHGSLIYVIGPEGGLVTQFSNVDDPDRMAKTLDALMK
jgi:protein SCO1/2